MDERTDSGMLTDEHKDQTPGFKPCLSDSKTSFSSLLLSTTFQGRFKAMKKKKQRNKQTELYKCTGKKEAGREKVLFLEADSQKAARSAMV